MTPKQESIVASRLATGAQWIFLQGGEVRSMNALAMHGMLSDSYYGGSLERSHLTHHLIEDFFNRHPETFLIEGHNGDLLLFDQRKFFLRFSVNERPKAERVLMGLRALGLQRAA